MVTDAISISADRGDTLSLMSFGFTPLAIEAPPSIHGGKDTVQQP